MSLLALIRSPSLSTAAAVFSLTLAPSLVAYFHLAEIARERDSERFKRLLSSATEAAVRDLTPSCTVLQTLAGAMSRRPGYGQADWEQGLLEAEWPDRYPSLLCVGFVEHGKESELLRTGLFTGKGMPALELPLNSPASRAALHTAGQSGAPTASKESFVPAAHTAHYTLVWFPVYSDGPRLMNVVDPDRAAHVRGYVVGAVAIEESARSSFLRAVGDLVDIQSADIHAPSSRDPLQRVCGFGWLGYTISSRVTPKLAFWRDSQRAFAWFVLVAGAVCAAALGGFAAAQVRARRRAEAAAQAVKELASELEQRIGDRTRELSDANARLQSEIIIREDAQSHLARFKRVVECTTDLVAMAGLDGSVLFMNDAGRQMLGLRLDEDLSAFRIPDFYPPHINARFEQEGFANALAAGSWSAELAMLHRGGAEIPVSFVGLVIRSPEGQPVYMACVARDSSARLQAEEELRRTLQRQQDLVRLKSSFVSTVSHEFRTPLGVIRSSADILANYSGRLPEGERMEHLHDIQSSTEQMAGMVENVLVLGQVDAAGANRRQAPLDLGLFCHRIVDEVQSATHERCAIELHLDPSAVYPAHGDESLLRHILTNLLGNAVKYSPVRGTVNFSLLREGTDALLTIQDCGIGIPASDVTSLFEPFARGSNVGDRPGTGLGLAIVKRCVDSHGGEIAVSSTLGTGSIFTVRLPLFLHPL